MNENLVIQLPAMFLSFGNFRFQKWPVFLHAGFLHVYFTATLMVCLFSVFASLKYILFRFNRTPEERTKWALNLDSWKAVNLKIIGLFSSSFWCTTFIFLLCHLRVCPWENQAGGDTTQSTDFAQTWHKCWVWWVNDYGKNLG